MNKIKKELDDWIRKNETSMNTDLNGINGRIKTNITAIKKKSTDNYSGIISDFKDTIRWYENVDVSYIQTVIGTMKTRIESILNEKPKVEDPLYYLTSFDSEMKRAFDEETNQIQLHIVDECSKRMQTLCELLDQNLNSYNRTYLNGQLQSIEKSCVEWQTISNENMEIKFKFLSTANFIQNPPFETIMNLPNETKDRFIKELTFLFQQNPTRILNVPFNATVSYKQYNDVFARLNKENRWNELPQYEIY
jgi:hypothetical protein